MLYHDVIEKGLCTLIEVNQETESKKWLELRTTGIGGSDSGAILGLNEYSSPLAVYLQKKGQSQKAESKIQEDTFEFSALEWGHFQENPVRKKVADLFNIKIETVPGMLKSKTYEFMNANLDGLVFAKNPICIGNQSVDGLGGLEIKTSKNGHGFGDEEIPDSYYAQVQHYMAVTGLEWFILSVLIDRKIKNYLVRRNEIFIDDLIERETDFWENYVMKDVAPAPNGSDNETDLIKSLDFGGEIELSIEKLDLLKTRDRLKNRVKRIEKRISTIENDLLFEMSNLSTENSNNVVAHCGSFKLSLTTQFRKSVDSEKLKKEGLYNDYVKESSCKVFRISGGKEK